MQELRREGSEGMSETETKTIKFTVQILRGFWPKALVHEDQQHGTLHAYGIGKPNAFTVISDGDDSVIRLCTEECVAFSSLKPCGIRHQQKTRERLLCLACRVLLEADDE